MVSRATGTAEGLVITAGSDPDDARGLRLRYVSGCALACHKRNIRDSGDALGDNKR